MMLTLRTLLLVECMFQAFEAELVFILCFIISCVEKYDCNSLLRNPVLQHNGQNQSSVGISWIAGVIQYV